MISSYYFSHLNSYWVKKRGWWFYMFITLFFTYRAFAVCVAFKHSALLVSSFSAFPQQCSRRWCPETLHLCLLLTAIYLLSSFSNEPLGNKWEKSGNRLFRVTRKMVSDSSDIGHWVSLGNHQTALRFLLSVHFNLIMFSAFCHLSDPNIYVLTVSTVYWSKLLQCAHK